MTTEEAKAKFGGNDNVQTLLDRGCLVITSDWNLVEHPMATVDCFKSFMVEAESA